MEQILQLYGFPGVTVTAMIMLDKKYDSLT